MWFLCLFFALLSSSYGLDPHRNNTVWLGNENLVIALETVSDNLRSSIILHNNDPKMRAFAIISELVLLYLNAEDTRPLSLVSQIKRILSEPSDVIAADPRKDIDALRAIIGQPINDIKRACKPYTTDMQCVSSLQYYIQQQKNKCAKYENHSKLRDLVEKIVLDKDFGAFLNGAIDTSKKGDDDLAVAYFFNSLYNYRVPFMLIREQYQTALQVHYSCVRPGSFDE